jgi:EAL and modified HD-GYP domain-containing signal transduction protein
MCERLGQQLGAKAPEKYFTMGLLSVLEALYESPMQEILRKLPLLEDISDALVNGTGELGLVLSCVEAYEAGEWMELKHLQLEPSIIRDIYLESIDWANHFSPLIS